MIKRLARMIAFPIGMILIIPCVLQWVVIGRNLGMNLCEWAIEGEWKPFDY